MDVLLYAMLLMGLALGRLFRGVSKRIDGVIDTVLYSLIFSVGAVAGGNIRSILGDGALNIITYVVVLLVSALTFSFLAGIIVVGERE